MDTVTDQISFLDKEVRKLWGHRKTFKVFIKGISITLKKMIKGLILIEKSIKNS